VISESGAQAIGGSTSALSSNERINSPEAVLNSRIGPKSCVFHRPGETLIAVLFGVGLNFRHAGGLHRPDILMVTSSLPSC
jgi:hypothetical protein